MRKGSRIFAHMLLFYFINPVLAPTNWTSWSIFSAIPDDTEGRRGPIKLETVTRKSESMP